MIAERPRHLRVLENQAPAERLQLPGEPHRSVRLEGWDLVSAVLLVAETAAFTLLAARFWT